MDKIVTLILNNQDIDSLKLQIEELDQLANKKLDGLGEISGTIGIEQYSTTD